jgi:hypothetical protein
MSEGPETPGKTQHKGNKNGRSITAKIPSQPLFQDGQVMHDILQCFLETFDCLSTLGVVIPRGGYESLDNTVIGFFWMTL